MACCQPTVPKILLRQHFKSLYRLQVWRYTGGKIIVISLTFAVILHMGCDQLPFACGIEAGILEQV